MVRKFNSVDNFLKADSVQPGILSINSAGLPIDVMNSPKDADTMVVFFHGAIESHYKVPVLTGQGISTGLNASRVFISDPALYLSDKLMLAWYAGNSAQPTLQTDLIRIIEKLAEANSAKRIIFFGGSGGGFASLFFASHFDNSIAVVFNPQTSISKYQSRAIHAFTHHGFGIDSAEYDPLSLLPGNVVTDLCDVYSDRRPAIVAYIQNLNDHAHVERHLRPFFKNVHPENSLHLLADAWGEGHSAPPKDVLSPILTDLVELPWDRALDKNGFQTIDANRSQKIAANGLGGYATS